MSQNIKTGQRGEEIACDYLIQKGFRIADRNWRNKTGELDIVAVKQGLVVAVEVKTRNGTGYGAPLESITTTKKLRLRRLLGAWAAENRPPKSLLRIDGIGITLQPDNNPLIEHVAGI